MNEVLHRSAAALVAAFIVSASAVTVTTAVAHAVNGSAGGLVDLFNITGTAGRTIIVDMFCFHD